MKCLLLLIGAFSHVANAAPIVVPTTTTTFTGSNITEADDWNNGLPTGTEVGLINIDTNIPSGLADLTFVQTAGNLTTGFNRTLGGMTWYLTGGSIASTANLQHVSGNPFEIYVLGGSISANQIRNRDGSLLYIESGSVTISGSTLNMNGGFTTFGLGNGTLTADGLSSDGDSRINFLAGSGGALTIAGFASSNYETLWNQGRLQFDGGNTGTFSDHFQVSDSTLTVIPEPSTLVLLGITGLAWVVNQRRRRK
ncbi:MAG: PEP-CTERM sorting domain-containing protein [Verrucomicrobia bacterium]|nr:PEP-CTERM sorting domain-containing protein [Verrucomicrobiota bacterium]